MSATETSRDERTTDASACFDEARASDWYDSLREQVDFHCSFCEALHLQISQLETKAKEAYAATARSMRETRDRKEIANRWLGLWYFVSEISSAAKTASESHRICGADLSEIETCRDEAWERFQLHCPDQVQSS